ncbi:MAG: 2-amino-4-hydroxy-6-hydroxymethyldihydropteridine diphosphokinase [Lunatimonas sp.]|uniref:2-amino-4-hydroxy-6- hydroxymethyldihydropteridine diphosphokinase n=1 Tax=Lunatimonas sp. TaxID=2060141 RepID=UPI00263BAD30|nr:2-amino-4-hydroxy-6-hydroxymethyldihydropteridine diphosphokinase [Lunatimonas sp.]MCC5938991.1 2-amino-4-hydroxy-6-hydroxymethyldihydropteridine diphosphokinase [Lunatimonas sp.]
MHKVVLLIGGNLGDRYVNICRAEEYLSAELQGVAKSSIYETAAWGGNSQGDFLNRVLLFETSKTPMEVLRFCQSVEQTLGRLRDLKWGNRTMDIDILYYDDEVLELPDLIIPHPFIRQRRFALVPLAELMPGFRHPVLQRTQAELLQDTADKTEVSKWHLPPE